MQVERLGLGEEDLLFLEHAIQDFDIPLGTFDNV
jgi:hypothetical protein